MLVTGLLIIMYSVWFPKEHTSTSPGMAVPKMGLPLINHKLRKCPIVISHEDVFSTGVVSFPMTSACVKIKLSNTPSIT